MLGSGHSARAAGFRFVVVVASLGGLPVLTTLVHGLPDAFPVPVLVISHRPRSEHDNLTPLLQKQTRLPVRPGTAGLAVWGPGITVIPGRTSATISGRQLALEPTTGYPDLAGDTLLASAAEAARPFPGIAVILSGMLQDGARGIRPVKRYGGRVLAQDPATARAAGMPSSAIATGYVDFVLPPHRLAAALVALTMAPGGAALLAVPSPHWAGLGPS
ncbi:MAG: chemotaxis protein CheB [Actinomycetota bacterium]|nr:chemotaxis protein CheB [Actinomycetota bacterium]